MLVPRRRALVVAASLVGLHSHSALGAETGAVPPRPSYYEPGFSVGLRTGFGFPLGDRADVQGQKDSLGSNFSGLLPLWLDAGYRISKVFYVGAYFQYGFLFVPDSACPPGRQIDGCSGHDIRVGPSVHFHIVPDGGFDPWVGLGLGYEAATFSVHGVEQTASRTNAGFEFANVQLGADVHPIFGIDWGPFVSFSIDEYTTETQNLPVGDSKTYKLPSPTIHYFLVLGMRVALDF